jgi:glutathione S-transferase
LFIGQSAIDVSATAVAGFADLQVLASVIGDNKFLFGSEPTSIDAGVYGFLANIYFYKIDTPLRKFVASHPNLIRHCDAVHAAVIKN